MNFQVIKNPTDLPEAVSTGYQTQNTNIVAARVGMDATFIKAGIDSVIVSRSGPVDVNGLLYSCQEEVTLTAGANGLYYIVLVGSGNNLTPTLMPITENYAYFSADRNAYYTTIDEYRILNWLVIKKTEGIEVCRNTDNPEILYSSDDEWVVPWNKYYEILLCGRGGTGGTGGSPFVVAQGGGGGGGGGSGAFAKRKIFLQVGIKFILSFRTEKGSFTKMDSNLISIGVGSGSDGGDGGNGTLQGGGSGGTAGGAGFLTVGCELITAGVTGSKGTAGSSKANGLASIGLGGAGAESASFFQNFIGSPFKNSGKGGRGGNGGDGISPPTVGELGDPGFIKIIM